MKRFLAYISMLVVMILGVVTLAKPTLQNSQSGFDFNGGREYIYQITDLGNSITDQGDEMVPEGAVDEIAETMEERLQQYGVAEYYIEIQGNNKISVKFSANSSLEYDHISNFLTFDGNLTLTTYDSEYIYHNYRGRDIAIEGDEPMFGVEDAYIVRQSIYPVLVIPLENPTEFSDEAIAHAETLNEEHASDEDTSVTDYGKIYLWSDWQEGDNFESANENQNIARKLVLYFDYNSIWYEQNEDEHQSICAYFNVEGSDTASDLSEINWNNVATANENAKYYMNLLNASHLNYRVNNLYYRTISPLVENITTLGSTIYVNVSTILICFIISYGLVMLISILLYGLNGLGLTISNAFAFLLLIGLTNIIGTTFNVAGLVGLVVSFILLMTSGFVYAHKLKKGLDDGKPIKKAYLDASKYSSIFTLDVSIALLFVGAFTYLLGGTYVSCFGIFVFFGTLINLLFNCVVNRVLTYFLTNSSVGKKNNGIYGIIKSNSSKSRAEEVEEEKSETSNTNEVVQKPAKKFTLKKAIGIFVGLLTIASVTTISYFGATSSSFDETQLLSNQNKIYFNINQDASNLNTTGDIENLLNQIKYEGFEDNQHIYDSVTVNEYTDYTNPQDAPNSVTVDYYLYEVTLNSSVDVNSALFSYETNPNITLSEAVDYVLTDNGENNSENSYFICPSESFRNYDIFNVSTIALAASIAIIAGCIYLGFRYGVSKAVATFIIAFVNSALCLSLLSLIRIPVNQFVGLATLAIMAITFMVSILMLAQNKEDIKELKRANLSIEEQESLILKNSTTNFYLYITVMLVSFISLCVFTGFSASSLQNLFGLSTLLGILLSGLFTLIALEPLTFTLTKLFTKITSNIHLPTSKKGNLKKQHKAKVRGKEVEEATFIGIND